MKLVNILTLVALLSASLAAPMAEAASIKEIFQALAEAAEPGNGNGHSVYTLKDGYNAKNEKAKLDKEVNAAHPRKNDCVYEIHSGIEGGLNEITDTWHSKEIAARIEGMNDKNLLRGIVYSAWDRSSGDAEYCSLATVRVYGVDGSVLNLDFNETD